MRKFNDTVHILFFGVLEAMQYDMLHIYVHSCYCSCLCVLHFFFVFLLWDNRYRNASQHMKRRRDDEEEIKIHQINMRKTENFNEETRDLEISDKSWEYFKVYSLLYCMMKRKRQWKVCLSIKKLDKSYINFWNILICTWVLSIRGIF